MVDFDVIVVGAGPCGSMAAKMSAEQGAKTLLLERKKEIGVPVRCGEGIGQHWVEELGVNLSKKCISARINGAALFSPDMRSKLEIRNRESKGYVIDRKVFDRELAIEAGRRGAEIKVKSEVIGVLKEDGKVCGVEVEGDGRRERISAKVVVACDGGESSVARMAGIDSTASLYDSDFGIEYEMCNVECGDEIEIYFSNEYAPRGYLWIFPKGKDVANVGVGIGGHCKPYAKAYLDAWIKKNKERFGSAQPVAVKGGIIPVGAPMRDLVRDGFIVAGTAAHQVDPIHGGGICLAMDAGSLAGKIAGKCALSGDTRKEALLEYERIWRKKREGKLLKRLRLRKVLEQLSDEDLNFIFAHIDNEDCEKLLSGDFAPVAKKVVFKRPALLKILRALM